jgi:hypothetical protein
VKNKKPQGKIPRGLKFIPTPGEAVSTRGQFTFYFPRWMLLKKLKKKKKKDEKMRPPGIVPGVKEKLSAVEHFIMGAFLTFLNI